MDGMSEKNLFIYRLKLTPKYEDPANWQEEDNQIIGQHAQFFHELGQKGVLLFAGRTTFEPGNENLFGIAVFNASSLEDAQAIMAQDPAAIHGNSIWGNFPVPNTNPLL